MVGRDGGGILFFLFGGLAGGWKVPWLDEKNISSAYIDGWNGLRDGLVLAVW